MSKSDDYRFKAEELRTIASDVHDRTLLAQLEAAAEQCERLADSVAKWELRLTEGRKLRRCQGIA